MPAARCGSCGTVVDYDEKEVGSRFQCPCGTGFVLPAFPSSPNKPTHPEEVTSPGWFDKQFNGVVTAIGLCVLSLIGGLPLVLVFSIIGVVKCKTRSGKRCAMIVLSWCGLLTGLVLLSLLLRL